MATSNQLSAPRLNGRLRAIRAGFYALVSVVAGTTTVFGGGSVRAAALATIIAIAVVVPMLVRNPRKHMELALWIDSIVALAIWWLFGPGVGVDFILFYIVAVSAFLLPRRRALGVIGAAAFAEVAQFPLHIWAGTTTLPLFHPETRVVSLGEFAAGVALRASAILLMAGLFLTVSAILSRSEDARKRSESRFRELYEEAPIAYLTVETSGTISRANAAAKTLFRRTAGVLVGSKCLDLYADTDTGKGRAIASLAEVRSGTPIRDVELLLGDSVGADRWVELSGAPVFDERGHVVEIRATLVEVTDRHRAERIQAEANAQLESLVEAKDRFIASVSHELRTPLSGVLGFTETLRADWNGFEDDEKRQFIGYISDQSREMSFLVEDLLVAARTELHELAVTKTPVDLEKAAAIVLDLCRHCDPEFRERVDTTVVGTASLAVGDAPRIRQVLRNLLTNALRYGGDTIQFHVYDEDETSVIELWDNGDGLPEEFVDTMFEPYAVAHPVAGVTESVGLGLSVAHSLAKLMGGQLSYSRERGDTVFQLRLPNATARDAAA